MCYTTHFVSRVGIEPFKRWYFVLDDFSYYMSKPYLCAYILSYFLAIHLVYILHDEMIILVVIIMEKILRNLILCVENACIVDDVYLLTMAKIVLHESNSCLANELDIEQEN